MNFEFSEDQLFIRDQARNFLSRECTAETVRAALLSENPCDQALWQKIVDLGWTGIAIPESHGGLGLGYLELCVIAEEMGRSLAPVPFASSVYLATEAIKRYGSDEQRAHYLPGLASGEFTGTLATSEGINSAQLNTEVKNHRANGCKLPVPDGDIADFVVFTARDSDGATGLYITDLADASVSREVVNSMDPSRSQARLVFNDCAAQKLGDAGEDALAALMDQTAVLLAFEQIGGCQAALDMGIAYTRERYAFGRAIASFQAIKHKFADMYVALELARANAYYGACALASDAPDLPLAAATARVSATDAYYLISKENIQAHGGMGFTWEFDCHLYYRRAQLLSSLIGALPAWKEKLTTRLLHAA